MTRIYWDSMLFVYLLEDHPGHADRVAYLLGEIERRGHTLCTGLLTVGEVLCGFYKRSEPEKAAQVRNWLRPPAVELLPFTAGAADRFARIRAGSRVTSADAIHLATAADAGVRLFLTNDRKLCSLAIDQIDFIADLNVNVY